MIHNPYHTLSYIKTGFSNGHFTKVSGRDERKENTRAEQQQFHQNHSSSNHESFKQRKRPLLPDNGPNKLGWWDAGQRLTSEPNG